VKQQDCESRCQKLCLPVIPAPISGPGSLKFRDDQSSIVFVHSLSSKASNSATMNPSTDNGQVVFDAETKVCFHCALHDFSSEVDALGQPMAEVEQGYVLDHCRRIDLTTWEDEFRNQTAVVSAARDLSQGGPSPSPSNTLSNPDSMAIEVAATLLECHICCISMSVNLLILSTIVLSPTRLSTFKKRSSNGGRQHHHHALF
jgi:hypothetical protein